METKKYYWIKLKTNFFNREDIDFMLSQENGCQYVVLYQMLCLNTANSDGRLETKMNEMIIPYDIKKIVRDTKYFDYDTVAVALDLYKKLGLIYEEENQILKIANYSEMIGSETTWAEKKRLYREKQKLLEDKVEDNVLEEYRDKSIENRDKNIDIKKENNKKKKFIPPTLEEVEEYCKQRNNNIDPKKFYDYYLVSNWKDKEGKEINNWKQKIITWEGRNNIQKEELPKWFDKEQHNEEPTKEEKEEMDRLLNQVQEKVKNMKR